MAISLKRAARFNPAWKPAHIFKKATGDAGKGGSDEAGTFLFDLGEETFGRLTFDQEHNTWVEETPWQGNVILVAISLNTPNP